MTVDEFVKNRVLPEYHSVVAEIRRLMRELAPDAQELVSYGIPVFKMRKIFAVISPTKKDITLSFTHGREFSDKYKLLCGVGKVAMHLKFKKVSEIDKEVVGYYVKQALEIDSK